MSLRSHERLNVIADNSRRACFFASHDGLCLSFEAGGFSEPGLGKHSWFNASGGEIRGGTVSPRGAVIIAHWTGCWIADRLGSQAVLDEVDNFGR
jgi:hypothetical protein